MASDTNVNSIISQGIAIKQIYNPKKQDLELQQHFNVQHTEAKKQKEKSKIKKTAQENRVENKTDQKKESKSEKKDHGTNKHQQDLQDRDLSPEGNFIDIKV